MATVTVSRWWAWRARAKRAAFYGLPWVLRLGRRYVGIELREEYAAMSRARLIGDAPMLAQGGGTA